MIAVVTGLMTEGLRRAWYLRYCTISSVQLWLIRGVREESTSEESIDRVQ